MTKLPHKIESIRSEVTKLNRAVIISMSNVGVSNAVHHSVIHNDGSLRLSTNASTSLPGPPSKLRTF